jgi:hypothetical protein
MSSDDSINFESIRLLWLIQLLRIEKFKKLKLIVKVKNKNQLEKIKEFQHLYSSSNCLTCMREIEYTILNIRMNKKEIIHTSNARLRTC